VINHDTLSGIETQLYSTLILGSDLYVSLPRLSFYENAIFFMYTSFSLWPKLQFEELSTVRKLKFASSGTRQFPTAKNQRFIVVYDAEKLHEPL
jgi:hypothetical protein